MVKTDGKSTPKRVYVQGYPPEFDTSLLFENDSTVMYDKPGFKEKVEYHLFAWFRKDGLSPEQAYPQEGFEKERSKYAAWLKQNPAK